MHEHIGIETLVIKNVTPINFSKSKVISRIPTNFKSIIHRATRVENNTVYVEELAMGNTVWLELEFGSEDVWRLDTDGALLPV